ncbi:CHAT domain-containing protein [Nonomuraea gerenzanensis]|uniref:CHAT domain-containing protein n=1 Tax=Nonomuraea gerenzanensis TaxID=93944 RepID=A0A1M4EBI3_9ACTN|nr:hypothetical protein BN4615_P5642 [Nonomuraea gerenzanensis]
MSSAPSARLIGSLHDGTLAIPEISRLRLDRPEHAYLSACSTAHRGRRLADEVIQLASAFQLAPATPTGPIYGLR